MCQLRFLLPGRGLVAVAVAILVLGPVARLKAHPNHAPLPTTGVTVQGEQLLLSETAYRRLGLVEAPVVDVMLSKTLRVNAVVGFPFDRQAMATTLVSGKIAEIHARPGDTVAQGDVLATVESLELTRTQLELLRAIGQRDFARRVLDRKAESAQSGVVAAKEQKEAQSALAEAQVIVDLTRRKLEVLGLTEAEIDGVIAGGEPVRELAITSPLTGIVLDADVRAGQVVRPEDHLYHVVDVTEVNLIGQILESDATQVAAGQPARFQVSATGQTFAGEISHVDTRVHPETRTLHVIVHAANPDGRLRPGAAGRMEIVVENRQVFAIPVTAVLGSGDETYVLARRGERQYLKTPVKLGLRDGERIEVTHGLFVGDRVITTGARVAGSLFGETGAPSTPTGGTDLAPTDSYAGPSLRVPGTIEVPTGRQLFASPRVNGRLRSIDVEPGTKVRKGQQLAVLVSPDLQILQLDLLLARLKHNFVSQRVESLESVSRVTARQELWQLQADRDRLSLEADDLARRLRQIGLTAEQVEALRPDSSAEESATPLVESVPLTAPIDGVLTHFDAVPGQSVTPNDRLFEVIDPSVLWVRGHVWQQYADEVNTGETVRVRVPALGDDSLSGEIVRISPALNDTLRVLPVWVELDNADGRLLPGMLATIDIPMPASPTLPTTEPRLTATE